MCLALDLNKSKSILYVLRYNLMLKHFIKVPNKFEIIDFIIYNERKSKFTLSDLQPSMSAHAVQPRVPRRAMSACCV